MVAGRDRISEDEARERVADTLRLVAAARDEATARGDNPEGLVDDGRRSHLVRAARARLWLDTEFEPSYQGSDIPPDDPALEEARTNPQYVRPRLHRVCQLIAVPDVEDLAQSKSLAADPTWQARARPVFDRAAARLERYVPVGDPQACQLMGKLLGLQEQLVDDVRLRTETGAFFLEACGKEAPDGSCLEPRWDTDWTSNVRKAESPGFLPAFQTQFGFHLVYVIDILEPRDIDDPAVDAELREAILPAWRHERLKSRLQTLRAKRAVRVLREPSP